jgi:crotonobetainyl-CoA:carnitine CoA-transferase CaiB-like acyl-CoA transferase
MSSLRPLLAGLDLPRAVRVYLTPFGLDEPYAGFRGSDFTDFAMSGHMFLNGDPDRPPLQGLRTSLSTPVASTDSSGQWRPSGHVPGRAAAR